MLPSVTLNPISAGGGGESTPPQTDIAHYAYFCLGHMCWNFLTFPITGIDSVWRKKKFKFWGGTPRTGPRKISKFQNFQKWPHMTSYNPTFLLQNQLVLSKLGCLQKTRAQNIDIWPNGGHFCDDEIFLRFPRIFFKKLFFGQYWNFFDFFFRILASWV